MGYDRMSDTAVRPREGNLATIPSQQERPTAYVPRQSKNSVKDWSSWLASTRNRSLLNLAGLALPITVWILGLVSPPHGVLTPSYVLIYTAVLVALGAIDQTMPSATAPVWRRLGWLGAEVILAF